MSKKNLAILVFCIAFGLNIFAFVFSKKTFHEVEEVKNVWIYELPQSASPFDAYSSLDIGPHQGVVGTLFLPNHATEESPVQSELADNWSWDDKNKLLRIQLKKGLTYGNGDGILASHFVSASQYVQSKLKGLVWSPEWQAWIQAKITAPTESQLIYELPKEIGKNFDFEKFAKQVLTHPLTGVIHPQNLAQLQKGEKITKDWISSGPYRIWKWNPKEIILASRNDFPVMLPKEFFRNLKFQSAPVKNPSCDFIQGTSAEGPTYTEHRFQAVQETLHVFWVCRSWMDSKAFCSNAADRESFAKVIAQPATPSSLLANKKVRYRIPAGSDAFRTTIRQSLEQKVKAAGGTVEEISYFFHNSVDTDIELEFVVTPRDGAAQDAENLAKLSSRLGFNTEKVSTESTPHLVGEISALSIGILMKMSAGDPFHKVFLDPNLEDKKLPL